MSEPADEREELSWDRTVAALRDLLAAG